MTNNIFPDFNVRYYQHLVHRTLNRRSSLLAL